MIGAGRNGLAIAYGASLLNLDLTSAPLIPLRLMSVNEAFQYVQGLPEHHHSYPVVDGAGSAANDDNA
jgi:hypothetical protein